MIQIHDVEYFERREAGERSAADIAVDPVARSIHLNLADRYAEKVAGAQKLETLHEDGQSYDR